jgi:hypothetical protein
VARLEAWIGEGEVGDENSKRFEEAGGAVAANLGSEGALEPGRHLGPTGYSFFHTSGGGGACTNGWLIDWTPPPNAFEGPA